MSLVKVDHSKYGLSETKATEVAAMFQPMLDKMIELESEANEIIGKEITTDLCKRAKQLRNKYVKVRTGTAEIHKELKQFYLQGGRFVDGWKNAQLQASQGIEAKLKDIETHFERIEAERLQKIRDERIAELAKYDVDGNVLVLSTMADDVWANYLVGVKAAFKAQKEAEAKAEADRIAAEKAEAEERERVRKENDKLKKEAIEREAKQAKERAKQEEILKKEREERNRIEQELKAKQAKELKAKQEAEEKAQAELSKGDAEKIKDFVNDLTVLKTKYNFKSAKNRNMYNAACLMIDKILSNMS